MAMLLPVVTGGSLFANDSGRPVNDATPQSFAHAIEYGEKEFNIEYDKVEVFTRGARLSVKRMILI